MPPHDFTVGFPDLTLPRYHRPARWFRRASGGKKKKIPMTSWWSVIKDFPEVGFHHVTLTVHVYYLKSPSEWRLSNVKCSWDAHWSDKQPLRPKHTNIPNPCFFDKRAAVTYSEVTTPLTYPDLKKSMFKQICSFNGNMYRHINIYTYILTKIHNIQVATIIKSSTKLVCSSLLNSDEIEALSTNLSRTGQLLETYGKIVTEINLNVKVNEFTLKIKSLVNEAKQNLWPCANVT